MRMMPVIVALVVLAVPARAAVSGFSLVMVEDCEPGNAPHSYDVTAGGLPFCLSRDPFLTGADILAARAAPYSPEQLASFGLINPHVLRLTLTAAAAQRLTNLSLDNRGESFAALVDDRIVSVTSIGDPFRSAELELLISLDDTAFAALVKQLGKAS